MRELSSFFGNGKFAVKDHSPNSEIKVYAGKALCSAHSLEPFSSIALDIVSSRRQIKVRPFGHMHASNVIGHCDVLVHHFHVANYLKQFLIKRDQLFYYDTRL